jgi:hypothetical protein
MRERSFTCIAIDQVRVPGQQRYVEQEMLLRQDSPSFSYRTSQLKGDVRYKTGKTTAGGPPWGSGPQESAEEFADSGSSR